MDRLIQKVYKDKEVISQMVSFFNEQSFLQLHSLFEIDTEKYISLFDSITKEKKYSPSLHSYSSFNLKNTLPFEVMMMFEYFKSKSFLNYLELITEIDLQFVSIEYLEFSCGDFTLLNDAVSSEDCIHVLYDLSDDDFEKEMGGTLTYTTREDELYYLEPLSNSLTLLYNPLEVMNFTKYVNCFSKNRKIRRILIKFDFAEEHLSLD